MALTAEDKLDIIELANRFGDAYDDEDLESWLDTFAEDGVLASEAYGTWRGKNELRAWFSGSQRLVNNKRHLTSGHLVRGDGDEAQMLCYLAVVGREGGAGVPATAVFTDVLKRVDGRWLFARRDQAFDPNAWALAEGLAGGGGEGLVRRRATGS